MPLLHRKRTWLLVGAGTAFLVVLLALTFRSAWFREPSATGDFSAMVAEYPPEFQAANFTYTLDPASQGARAVATQVGERVRAQAIDAGLNIDEANAIEAIVVDRTSMLLAPDYETWRGLSGKHARPGADPSDPKHEKFREWWAFAAGFFQASPIAGAHVQLRLIDPGAEYLIGVPGTIFSRAGGFGPSTRYPGPPTGDSTVRVVEVLIPMMFRVPDGTSLPVTACMRYWKSAEEPDWRPTDLVMYFDNQAFGHKLADPIW